MFSMSLRLAGHVREYSVSARQGAGWEIKLQEDRNLSSGGCRVDGAGLADPAHTPAVATDDVSRPGQSLNRSPVRIR
jgi:hypothetical protein